MAIKPPENHTKRLNSIDFGFKKIMDSAMNIDKLNLVTLYFLELIKSSCKKTDDAKFNIIFFFPQYLTLFINSNSTQCVP